MCYLYYQSYMTGSQAADGHVLQNSIPLSIFPIAPDKFCFCFCGLPGMFITHTSHTLRYKDVNHALIGRGKTHISRRLAQYLSFFHAVPVKVFNVAEYRKRMCGGLKDAEWFDYNNAEAWALRDSCNKVIHSMYPSLSPSCLSCYVHVRRLFETWSRFWMSTATES